MKRDTTENTEKKYRVSRYFCLSSWYDVKPIVCKQFFFIQEKSGAGSGERCDEVIYHLFKVCLIDCTMFLFFPPSPSSPCFRPARLPNQLQRALDSTPLNSHALSPPSRLSVMSVRHVCPLRLSVTSVRHVCPSCLSVTSFVTSACHACPSHLSVTSIRHVRPSHLSVTSVRHIRLSITSVHHVCPSGLSDRHVHMSHLSITSVRQSHPSITSVCHVCLSSPSNTSVRHVCPSRPLGTLLAKYEHLWQKGNKNSLMGMTEKEQNFIHYI